MPPSLSVVASQVRGRRASLFSALMCALLAGELATAILIKAQETSTGKAQVSHIEFDTDEGTWTDLDVSPDGKTILFDLLGDIYTLPIAGGQAKLLLGGPDWDHMPRFSPDGKQIVFVSDRDGVFNLWLMNADGSQQRQLTKKSRGSDMNGPMWTPDGRYIIVAEFGSVGLGANGPLGIYMYDLRGGGGIQLVSQGIEPAMSPDNRFLYSSQYSGSSWNISRLDRISGESLTLTTGGPYGGVRPLVSPDGRYCTYATLRDGVTSLRVRELSTGKEHELSHSTTPMRQGGFDSIGNVPAYTFMPDGRSVLISIGGKIHRIDVADGADHVIPIRVHVSQQIVSPILDERRVEDGEMDVRVIRWPTLSPDEKRLAFSALGKLYIMDVPDGRPQRITSSKDLEYYPAFSPDGKWIAYTTWSDSSYGQVKIISPDGLIQRTLTKIGGRYANPTWSSDGSRLAFVRGSGAERRGEWSNYEQYFELMWSGVGMDGPNRIALVPPPSSWQRYYPSISFNSDGSRILFSDTSGSEPALVSMNLDGSDRRKIFKSGQVLELVPSPDGERVAILRADSVKVATLPPEKLTATEVGAESVPVKEIAAGVAMPGAGAMVSWCKQDALCFGIATHFFIQRLNSDQFQELAEVGLQVPKVKPSGTIAFINARIVTMRGDEILPRGTIVVVGNRIATVTATDQVRLPKEAVVVDATGKTIIPGLIDTHAHMHEGNREFQPELKWEYLANLAYGVTTILDPQAPTIDTFAQSELVDAGAMIGPRVYTTGRGIWGADPAYQALYFGVNSSKDANDIVTAYQAFQPVILKDYVHLARPERQWLSHAAREHHIRLTAEGSGTFVRNLTMVMDGYTSFEHDLPIELHRDVIQLMARSGVFYTPTLMSTYGGAGAKQYFELKEDIYDDHKLRRFTPAAEERGSQTVAHVPDNQWFFMTVARGAAEMLHAGGHVTVGREVGPNGLGTLWEAWGIGMGGLTPLETLRIATLEGAEKLGLQHDLGSLEAGKLADFVVLTANPLDDIHNLAKQEYVVKNGFVYDSASMTELWPEVKTLPKFFWMSDADAARFKAPVPKSLAQK